MKSNYLMHGISAGWIIRSKNPLFKNGTYMEFNWNGLQNFNLPKVPMMTPSIIPYEKFR